MRPCLFPLIAALAVAPLPALSEEANLDDEIARLPGMTLMNLLPTALILGATGANGISVNVGSNAADAPFDATFEIMLPVYPNVTIALLVSEREAVTGMVSSVLSMAASGTLPGGSAADTDALPGVDCVGVVDQNMINCMIGSAGIQFTATDFLDGGSIDYAATKRLFERLPVAVYREAFGS